MAVDHPGVPRTRFAILTYQRTGSTLLMDALDSHPEVMCHGEVFHPDAVWYTKAYPRWSEEATRAVAERDADPRGFLERLYADDFGHAAVGFKLMPGHAAAFAPALMRDQSIAKIVLRRENRVRVFVSNVRAATIKNWNAVPYDGLAIHVDHEELQEFARLYDAYYYWIDACLEGQRVLRVSYESLFSPARLERLLEFIRVDPDPFQLSPTKQRQSHDGMRKAISNYDELAEQLAGTPLADELAA
jgi:LPS sulfotransferase NodH